MPRGDVGRRADSADPLRRFFSRAKRLGRAFGPVLYQLPPGWLVNLERLEQFVTMLPRAHRQATDFREPT